MKKNKDTDLLFTRQDVEKLLAGKDAQIAALEARIIELEALLKVPKKTSQNSSSRPSNDHKSNKSDGETSSKEKRKGHGKGLSLIHI